jgi:hypothetical protein
MQASNNGAAPVTASGLPHDEATFLQALWDGAEGRAVRCVPARYTVMATAPDGRVVFAKLRRGRARDAAAEWRWLHVLPMLGFQVPTPVAFVQRGRRSMLVTAAVAGRSADALARQALEEQRGADVAAFVVGALAPLVRSLHAQGLVFRDLYWNHLFAAALDDSAEITLLDVERVFRPRWRRRRWIVKDLAGLLASSPVRLPCRIWLRALRAYFGGWPPGWKGWVVAIRHKAARIQAHAPKYG